MSLIRQKESVGKFIELIIEYDFNKSGMKMPSKILRFVFEVLEVEIGKKILFKKFCFHFSFSIGCSPTIKCLALKSYLF